MATSTVEERLASIEARFEATLPHLATKADLEELRSQMERTAWRLSGLMVVGFGVVIGALRLWQ